MGSRMKEDERTEKAIRSLLKLPENRRCINCNSLVGTTFLAEWMHSFWIAHCSFVLNLNLSGSTICLLNFLDFCLHKLQRNPVSLFLFSFHFSFDPFLYQSKENSGTCKCWSKFVLHITCFFLCICPVENSHIVLNLYQWPSSQQKKLVRFAQEETRFDIELLINFVLIIHVLV